MEKRLASQKVNINGVKRLRQPQLDEIIDHDAIALAHKKDARFIYCTNHSLNSCEHMSYREMISAVSKAGQSYVGSSEYMVWTRLLEEEFEDVKQRNDSRINSA